MNGNETWVWFVAGIIPYHIEREAEKDGKRVLTIAALFWSMEVHSHVNKGHRWIFQVPVVERLRDAAWTIVIRLQQDKPPHG